MNQSDNVSSVGSNWLLFGQKFPREEIVFFCQIVILYTIIICSIYNLSGEKNERLSPLWISLLGSSVGYLLPNPTISKKKDVLHNSA